MRAQRKGGTILGSAVVFLGAAAAFALWRWSNFIVWDDTSTSSYNIYVGHGHFALDRLRVIFAESFSYIQPDGYRPISAIVRGLGAAVVYSIGIKMPLFVGVDAAVFGLAAVLLLDFSRGYLQTAWGPWIAALLFFSATPVLTSTLVLFSGIQLLAVCAILAILLSYRSFKDERRPLSGLLLCFALVVGPWVREVVAIAPALILVDEFLEYRRVRPVGAVAALGFLHALFPTFIVSQFVATLPVRPVFAMGNMAAYLGASHGGGLRNAIMSLHWRIFGDLLSIMSPTLTVFAFCYSAYWLSVNRYQRGREYRAEIFLLTFLAAAFVPFLKLFNEQVHLTYVLIPLVVLVARQLERVVPRVEALQSRVPAALFGIALVLVTLDSAVNVIAVRQATRDIYAAILHTSEYFVRNFTPNTIVISNAHLIEDIRFYTHGYIDPWDAVGGTPDSSRWLTTSAAVEKVLQARGDRPAYFLDVHIPVTQGQRGADRQLVYVRDNRVATTSLGHIATVRFEYPYFDPLRFFLPTTVATWPGPPDLEFDFYRGPAISGTPFMREVAGDFDLYRIDGNDVAPSPASKVPVLLAEDFHGFNLIGLDGTIYAILQSDGAFDVGRFRAGGYRRQFQGKTVQSVEAEILHAPSSN